MSGVNDSITREIADTANVTICQVHTKYGSLGNVRNKMNKKKIIRAADAKVVRVKRVDATAT
jgi:hypothetical protein